MTGGVLVLHKTLDILEKIGASPDGARLSELARAVGMPKATVYRILKTLESRGFLERKEDGAYRVARKLFDLQQASPVEEVLSRVAPAKLEELANECRETVNLGLLDAGEVVVLHTFESPQTVRMTSKIGDRRHLHSTALGKVLLASLPEKEMLRLLRLKGLPRLTPYTIVSRITLLKELERTRELGYAIDNQENELEARCVAAPILGRDGVVAALSISGPVFRLDAERARGLAPRLKEVCAAISAAGWS